MKTYTNVSRKTVGEDRVAICPNFGCEYMTRVIPLKFRFLGFGKYPKCKKHHIPLVYIDERIGDFVDAALACLFDKGGLPPSELFEGVKSRFSHELESFVEGWVYSITVGRGAPIVSRYMDAISNVYLKQLTKKQIKTLKKGGTSKPNLVNKAIKNGMDEITIQYTRILKHLRAHSEVLTDHQKLQALSKSLQNYLKDWQKNVLEHNEIINSPEKKYEMALKEIKSNYDQILNVGTCRCLLGLNPDSKELKKAGLTAFDRYSAYHEFYTEGLTMKFTKFDINRQEKRSEDIRVLNKNQQKHNKKTIYNYDKNENLDNKLVKSLIKLIYEHEFELVEFEKSSTNKLNLNITDGTSLRRFNNLIVASDISKILGISLDTAKRWSYQLELLRKKPLMIIRPTTFKKICEHIEIFSNHTEIYTSFSAVLTDYHEKKYNKDFLNMLVSIFNKYIKGGGGKSWFSQILGKSRAYIFDLEHRRGERGKGGPEHYAKYFNLLTSIHLINEEKLDFKDGLNISDLKAECHNLIFKEIKNRNMIKELCESKYSRRIVNTDNRELFDIVIHSLLALTKIERGRSNKNSDFVYDYTDLSRLISNTNSRDFLTGKFRNGYILAKTEGIRLIKEIRKGFFNAPGVCHNAIYRIKTHINNPHWREYEKHFIDLRGIQRKELLDLSLGLDIYDKDFIEDAHPFVTKDGQIIKGRYVFYITRHHLDEDQKHYLIFDYNSTDFMFKIILLASKSHWKVHANKEEFNKNKVLLNARMKHLYKILNFNNFPKRNCAHIIKSEFNNETIMINSQEIKIWDEFPEKIIEEWIRRWKARKILSDKEFYKRFYPNFYNYHYKPLLREMELFRQKNSNCKKPEFWYWYFRQYLKKKKILIESQLELKNKDENSLFIKKIYIPT